jgi:hypothetical protein
MEIFQNNLSKNPTYFFKICKTNLEPISSLKRIIYQLKTLYHVKVQIFKYFLFRGLREEKERSLSRGTKAY